MYKYRQIDFKLHLKCKKWRSNIGGCLLIIIPLKKMPLGVFKERLLAKRSSQQTFTNVYIIVRKAIVSCDNPWVAHMDGLPDFTSSHLTTLNLLDRNTSSHMVMTFIYYYYYFFLVMTFRITGFVKFLVFHRISTQHLAIFFLSYQKVFAQRKK